MLLKLATMVFGWPTLLVRLNATVAPPTVEETVKEPTVPLATAWTLACPVAMVDAVAPDNCALAPVKPAWAAKDANTLGTTLP